MGTFKINGTNILDIAEVVNNSDARTKSLAFSSGKLNVTGLADSAKTLVNAPSGYIYSRDILGGKLKVNGVADTVSLRGYRPPFLTNVANTTAFDSYFNWFDDGEVYISPTANTRSGTRISTAEQKRRSFFVHVVGSGGGGGSGGGAGSSNVANGGGSGGAIWGNVTLEANTTNYFPIAVGSGGAGGTGRNPGGSGGITRFGYSSSAPNLVAGGGGGGGGAGDSTLGSGGGNNYNERTTNNATMIQFGRRNGIYGASRGTTSAAMPVSYVTRYMPEGGTAALSSAYNNDSRTGSGTASGCGGCGALGKGGYSVGDGQHGNGGGSTSGGSGSGCGFAFTGTGGNGGRGYIRIFY